MSGQQTDASDALSDLGQAWAYWCADGGPEEDDSDDWDNWHDGAL